LFLLIFDSSLDLGDDVSFKDEFTVSDVSRAVYELDAVKFTEASFDQFPYKAVALPFGTYLRLFSPWRHEKWPYSEAQAKWRQHVGVNLRLTTPLRDFFL
jgi:hypothetical protein